MRREDLLAFSELAAQERAACWGEEASWDSQTIPLVCHLLSDLELEAGGWEATGVMRALTSVNPAPSLHDTVIVRGKNWIVRQSTSNPGCVETSLVLEAQP